jgi:transposase
LWIAHTELASAPGHPFYDRLSELLDAEGLDSFVEAVSAKFYAEKFGRPSLLPGIHSRSIQIGCFEGIESERGIAWSVADSLRLRQFLGIALTEATPGHSTPSRTRRLIDLEAHKKYSPGCRSYWPIADCYKASGIESSICTWSGIR